MKVNNINGVPCGHQLESMVKILVGIVKKENNSLGMGVKDLSKTWKEKRKPIMGHTGSMQS